MNWHARYQQQARWTKNTRDYLFKRAGLDSAKRILEVGCGTGALWEQLPLPAGACAHGLDLRLDSVKQTHANAPGLLTVNAAGEDLPYPDSFFDLVFCHYLLLWVQKPGQILREMARVTRPGGAVLALAEPDHAARIDHPPGLQALGAWQTAALLRQGVNPRMGRELAGGFAQAGITLIENGVIGGGWSGAGPAEMEMEWAVLEADLTGAAQAADIQKMKELDAQARRDSLRVLFVPTFYAWGRV
ncbi:MAG: class I SAM-dependent methyltransferase [Anaerolineales bacterium]|nr:class I SAM-dependent methyltransferase [Anaerolineales bacterium]